MRARRPWAWPLVPLYRAALAAKEALRGTGVLRERRLRWPVVSVGSLSAGGAGKTPVVIALVRLLQEHGWVVDVLSRGYGREGSDAELVLPHGEGAARFFGDEPVLIVERTAAPVWVGKDRFAAGEAAENFAAGEAVVGAGTERRTQRAQRKNAKDAANGGVAGGEGGFAGFRVGGGAGSFASLRSEKETARMPRGVHVLDDGFQHRQLARTFDVVLVTAEDLDDALLPAGNLREPMDALKRADAVVVREDESDEVRERVRALLREGTPVWTIRRALRFPAPLGVFGAGLRPLAFCAIARPEGFVGMLKAAGCGVVDAVVFRDHARYGEREIRQILRFARELNATGLVTTEKDAVKLPAELRARMEEEIGPVMVVALDAQFVYRAPVWRVLGPRLEAASRAVREEQPR